MLLESPTLGTPGYVAEASLPHIIYTQYTFQRTTIRTKLSKKKVLSLVKYFTYKINQTTLLNRNGRNVLSLIKVYLLVL